MPHLIVDLSNNNASVDLERLRRSGIEGMWHKVAEGENFVDRYWPSRSSTGRKVGLRVGGYYFARPRVGSAVASAQFFCSRLGRVQRADLRPALDFELNPHGLSPAALVTWARTWNQEVRRLTGVGPIFYSYPAFMADLGAEQPIGYGLWLASYGRDDGHEHPYQVPRPWKRAQAHQFSSRARVAGVAGECDLSSARRLWPLLAHPVPGLLL